ncbi:MAG: hypothetical protein L0196_08045 [candidate division Zixibacteria bacterium]|nr:hypothetical protein [candidate division Zixibacteria bacterium]
MKNPNVLLKIGNSYLVLADTANALKSYNSSINLNPYQKEGYSKVFNIHYSRNDFSTAYNALKKSFEVNPNDFEVIYWLGKLEKHFLNNHSVGDSLLKIFYENSGVKGVIADIKADKSDRGVSVNGRSLNRDEMEEYFIESALEKFPYVDDLYQKVIEFYSEKQQVVRRDEYLGKYIYYSKLNTDSLFVKKYSH